MTRRLFSRAAKSADQIVAAIADRLNGNAARRRAIKQRLAVAMMATERHQLVADVLHPLPLAVYEEPLPVPDGWPDAPCGRRRGGLGPPCASPTLGS